MPGRPNIILINCDDLGFGDLGCYGSALNLTPALDRLAAEGTRFTGFYMASSICTPSRAAMLTGCYPPRIGMNRVLFPADPEGLNPGEETIAALLGRAGYATALVGKWHLGDQPDFLPRRFGFDHYYGLPFSNDMGRQAGDPADKAPLPLLLDDEVIEEQPDQSGLTARYVEESIRFMRRSTAEQRPFFLYLAHMYVHIPLYVPEPFLRASRNGRYGAAVACIDWAWARLDHELNRLGIADDTLVLFTSDNGSRARGEGGSNAPFRGTKFSTWEGGFRLPLIARWPGRIPRGAVCDEISASIDLLPTLASFAGAEPQRERPIDGIDLSGLFTGTARSQRDSLAYYAYGRLAAVRKGRWKRHYCQTPADWGKPYEVFDALFDLEEDPGENRNVVAEHPEVAAELDEVAEGYRRELGDVFRDQPGPATRPCGKIDDPCPLSAHNPASPYVIAEYDLADRG